MTHDKLSDHQYDGIQEYDNPQPAWWTWLFLATFVFAVVYFIYYEAGGPGLSPNEAYEAEMAAFKEKNGAKGNDGPMIDIAILEKMASDPAALGEGKATYLKFCVACHLPDGGGLIGPNLTDDYWLHGGGLMNIFHTVSVGVPEKGMAPWAKQLPPEELQKVVAYVSTLRGTTPATPKAPQGDLWSEP